ncbi:MFS general substrate transporter [Pisolithus orientalis]|uniref:MFS general substrate transporter n=1 Tax=Pisolithus orientalis TaxID=936130 RepID=UPI002224D739|nr:MFS general substrate transporter [Pisolithus orientalis]KAI5990303.1 MFS general substrate transporter [Pisolithus orientalis]
MPLHSDKASIPEKTGIPFGLISSPDVPTVRQSVQVSLDPEQERKLWRKIDLHLMPIISLMYLFSFMDRGNAKLEGLMTQLHLTGSRYNVALSVFFISYGLFEFPANIMLQFVRPSRQCGWFLFITLLITNERMSMGFVKSYPQLVAIRFLLGVAEAGFFPGVAFFLTMWYPKYKLMYRIALFTGAAGAAGAFSGLFAYGIAFMNNVGHLEGWSWIFIIEGLVTIVISFVAVLVLADYPGTAKFLSVEERQFVEQQRSIGIVDDEEGTVTERVLSAFLDWQVWLTGLMLMSFMAPAYGITFFLPFGYSVPISQLLTVPIFVLATISMISAAHFSDTMKLRSPFIIVAEFVGMVGYIIQITNASTGVKYFGTYLAVVGMYTGVPCVVGWLANNLHGRYKRAVGMALQAGMGNFGGIIASYIFRIQDEPRFILGFALEIGFMCMGLIAAVAATYVYHRANVSKIVRAKREGMNETEYAADLYTI